MNKYQEALDKYGNHYWFWGDDERFQADLKTLQELVDRATPKKPIKDDEDIYDDGICPNCKSWRIGNWEFSNVFYKHCADCGQALDWTNESE